jgi:hypothetical protein
MLFALITVLLTPWHGPSLPTAPTGQYATKYALTVHGTPNERVDLRADGAAKGWIAAFCTPRLCAEFHTSLTLDKHGIGRLQFDLVRIDPKASPHTRVIIQANNRPVAHASR